jgi:Trk-type K+ transport system membrane component
MQFLGNVYYRFYRLLLLAGEEDIPRYNAVLLMSLPSMLNVITIAILLGNITDTLILINLPKVYLLMTGFVVIAVNSYFIFGKKRYLAIEERYRGEQKSEKLKNTLKAITYIVGSVLLFVFALLTN